MSSTLEIKNESSNERYDNKGDRWFVTLRNFLSEFSSMNTLDYVLVKGD